MAETVAEPLFKGNTGRNTRGILRLSILVLIAAAAIASRLFSVIRTYASSPAGKSFHFAFNATAVRHVFGLSGYFIYNKIIRDVC